MVICHLDNSSHASYKELNVYLGRLRYKQETYYLEYCARKDKLTGEPIPFKNVEQYFAQDFLDKRNLKKWLKTNPIEGRAWAIEWLKTRKAEKNLVYAPSHVELRTLPAPSLNEFAAFEGGYQKVCDEVGLINRYVSYLIQSTPKMYKILDISTIVVDTREQAPLTLDGTKIISEALKVGDYGLPEPEDRGVYIERKSLNDFIGTLGKGLARFTRELERAKQAGHYVVMLVETDINSAVSFNHLPHIARHVRVQPSHIFKGLRDLLTLYPLNFQCVFADGRVEAARLVKVLLGMGDIVKQIDLQYSLEQKLL